MALSAAATSTTVSYADALLEGIKNPPPPPVGLTWADIFGDDEALEAESSSSGASLSPLNSDDLELDDEDDSFSSIEPEQDEEQVANMPPLIPPLPSRAPHTYAHRKEFEQLQARQYWRDEYVWRGDKGKARAFDIGDASTLGPTLHNVLGAVEIQREVQITCL